jgi:hypothetical protein
VDLSHLAQEFLEIQRPFQLVMPSEKKNIFVIEATINGLV